MEEKRRAKRLNVDMELVVSSLFKQDNVKISNVDLPIEVINISKTGISFITKSNLPLDYYFNASIKLGHEDNIIYSVVKIIRCTPMEDGNFNYGCEFVGLAPILNFIFDDFEKENNL